MGRMGMRGGFGRTRRPSHLTRAQRRILITHYTPEESCKKEVNDLYHSVSGHLRRATQKMDAQHHRSSVYWYGEAVKAQGRLVDRARTCGLGVRSARMMLVLEQRRRAFLDRWFE